MQRLWTAGQCGARVHQTGTDLLHLNGDAQALRTGGEQKVAVQHVSVNEGGQAIVGNVTQTSAKVAPQTHATSTPLLNDGSNTPMPIIEATREKVPLKRKPKNGS